VYIKSLHYQKAFIKRAASSYHHHQGSNDHPQAWIKAACLALTRSHSATKSNMNL